MKNNLNKERVVAWLSPKTIKRMESIMQTEDMKNHTEFMARAVEFYIGYLSTQDSTVFLSDSLLLAINGTIQTTENRVANNLFRLTVELSMLMNLLAYEYNIDAGELGALRERCVRDVKRTGGKISLEDAISYQESDS